MDRPFSGRILSPQFNHPIRTGAANTDGPARIHADEGVRDLVLRDPAGCAFAVPAVRRGAVRPPVTEGLERRLVAVMFTDVVGYTALMQQDEQAAVDTRDRYMSPVQRHHDAFQGTIVQRLGDGTMSMFPSALDAVLAAVGLQAEL